MSRSAALLSLTLLLTVLVGGPAAAKAKAATPLAAVVTRCQPAKDASGGQAVFVGSMPLVPGAAWMEMQFVLLRSDESGTAVPVALPKWGVWLKADQGRSGFVYRKRIQGLAGPAGYRAVVRFRWKDGAGRVVKTAQRTTRKCAQPDLRPNLVPGAVTAHALAGGQAQYSVVVRNTGLSPAGPFAAGLLLDDGSPLRVDLTGLDAGTRSTVSFTGARCAPGGLLEAAVDPSGLVAESDETDNVVDVPCPFG